MKRGLRPIPNHILERMLELASDDDLAKVLVLAQYVDYSGIRMWSLDRILSLVLEWAKANPASARVLLATLEAELAKLGLAGHAVRVTEEHLDEWESYPEVRLRDRPPPTLLRQAQARGEPRQAPTSPTHSRAQPLDPSIPSPSRGHS